MCRHVVLPNGLTALLISDPEMADAVAAADGRDAEYSDAGQSGSGEVSNHVERMISNSWTLLVQRVTESGVLAELATCCTMMQ